MNLYDFEIVTDVVVFDNGTSERLVINLERVDRIHFAPNVVEFYLRGVPKPLVATNMAELANRRTNWVVMDDDNFVNLNSSIGYYLDKEDYKNWELEQYGENTDTDNVPYDDWAVRKAGV